MNDSSGKLSISRICSAHSSLYAFRIKALSVSGNLKAGIVTPNISSADCCRVFVSLYTDLYTPLSLYPYTERRYLAYKSSDSESLASPAFSRSSRFFKSAMYAS